MRVLVLHAHPVETSYNAALHQLITRTLAEHGHQIDDCDLYAEGFDPVLSRAERLDYHDTTTNQAPVQRYVDRLLAAEGIVFCFPVWCFGLPAMLKGWFDRVMLPGVSFVISADGTVTPNLRHIRKVAVVTSYGRQRWVAWYTGDPPRKTFTRYFRRLIAKDGKVEYLAHYHMNVSTDVSRSRFMAKVQHAMERF